jgi:hypothetical protein
MVVARDDVGCATDNSAFQNFIVVGVSSHNFESICNCHQPCSEASPTTKRLMEKERTSVTALAVWIVGMFLFNCNFSSNSANISRHVSDTTLPSRAC